MANAAVYTASTLAFPLDVIKKRIVADVSGRQYAGIVDCAAQIARREGVRGFFRFYAVDLAFKFGGGILLVLYDELRRYGGVQ